MPDARAAILEDEEVRIVDDLEVDDPREGEVLLELVAAGVCGSDLALRDGRFPFPTPAVLGHEATGRVVALGPGTAGPPPGTRVTLWMRPPCRACRACMRGEAGLCERSGFMSAKGTLLDGRTGFSRASQPVHRGFGVGAFSSRVVMPASGLVPVPDGVDDDVAALVGCGVATGAGAVMNVARPAPGDAVLVLGGGGVGISAAMTAAALGAGAVIVADPVEHRREHARSLGATHAIEGGDRNALREQLREAVGDTQVDVAIDAVGRPELLEAGYAVVRQGGTVVAVGLQPADAEVRLRAAVVPLSHKRLLGCFMGGIDPQRDIPRLFELYASGRLPIDRLVTARRPIDEAAQALDDLAAGVGLRTILDLTVAP
jgi:2-desacetyl-2-hydroxyethyl bacteriochlorophyllide A dehydrogenase